MRLTHKHRYKKDSQRFVFDMKDYRKACQKLGQLENWEEELGIDLITLFKALKNGAYIPFYGQVIPLERYKLDFPNKRFFDKHFNGNEWEDTLYFKDYGKTWALTEEELL